MNSEQLKRAHRCNDITLQVINSQFSLKKLYVELAELHEQNARELLAVKNVDGYIDLFAAIASWEDAYEIDKCLGLLEWGKTVASQDPKHTNTLEELERQEKAIRACMENRR